MKSSLELTSKILFVLFIMQNIVFAKDPLYKGGGWDSECLVTGECTSEFAKNANLIKIKSIITAFCSQSENLNQIGLNAFLFENQNDTGSIENQDNANLISIENIKSFKDSYSDSLDPEKISCLNKVFKQQEINE